MYFGWMWIILAVIHANYWQLRAVCNLLAKIAWWVILLGWLHLRNAILSFAPSGYQDSGSCSFVLRPLQNEEVNDFLRLSTLLLFLRFYGIRWILHYNNIYSFFAPSRSIRFSALLAIGRLCVYLFMVFRLGHLKSTLCSFCRHSWGTASTRDYSRFKAEEQTTLIIQLRTI